MIFYNQNEEEFIYNFHFYHFKENNDFAINFFSNSMENTELGVKRILCVIFFVILFY